MVTPFNSVILPVMGQIMAALAGLSSLALFPPARGTMLLVSITGRPMGEIANAAIAAGARIARRGPFDHSLIVVADRTRLTGLLHTGLIPLAAPDPLCGR